MTMLFKGQELAARIERADALRLGQIASALRENLNEPDLETRPVGAGMMAYVNQMPLGPQNRAVGLGFGGENVIEALDEVEAFYRGHGVASQVDLCPLADPALGPELARRGYRPLYFSNLLALDLKTWTPPSDRETVGVVVQKVTREDTPRIAQIAADGFGYPPGGQVFRSFLDGPEATAFVSQVNGQEAACGVYAVQDGMASLYLGATRPEFRNRRAQLALTFARLVDAKEAGCDVASVVTSPGSVSQRNMERAGFQVAYSKLVMVREWE
jgi:hypothetical protein